VFNGAGGPFSKVPALKATGPFSVYRRTFQMDQMSCNLILQDGNSEFAVTVVKHNKLCISVRYTERWLG
jgi:hypothetical protein